MEQVKVTFSEETLGELERIADRDHGGDRDAAAAALLDEWIEDRP